MRSQRSIFLSGFVLVILSAGAWGQAAVPNGSTSTSGNQASAQLSVPAPSPASFDQVIDKIVEREHFFLAQLRHYQPLAETYIQNLKDEKEMGPVPVSDQYFFGRLDMTNGTDDRSFMAQPSLGHRVVSKLTSLYSVKFLPEGFAQMVVLDDDFQKKFYDFTYVRREFLGQVRCLVVDVRPKKSAGSGRFIGRVWVEDQEYNIVRFNGTYGARSGTNYFFHFDSWRLNMRPGLWLPAYIYSQESDAHYRMTLSLNYKAQTRLWGYDLPHIGRNEEFTQILVDAPQTVHDQSEAAQDATPVEGERLWERQAEQNASERLQRIGLIAPPGDVDKVLETVVNNLAVTNNLDIQPEVHCRVLLTTPLESFTIGHTIVVSRGLLDVLPDEASLAMILAHEVGHIVLGHKLNTNLAFSDQMLFPDQATFERLDFSHGPDDEAAADKKAVELLKNSPYKDKLANAGLFLKLLQARAPALKNLIRPHLGDSMLDGKSPRMAALLSSAPQLEMRRTDQIAALPLGGRIKLDPWSDRIEMLKTKPLALTSAQEKMPLEVTPFFPYLTRINSGAPEKVALTEPSK